MSQSVVEFESLSVAERIQLVEDIWDSIVAQAPESIEVTDAQRAEIRRRVEAHAADPTAAVPWEQARARLLKRGD